MEQLADSLYALAAVLRTVDRPTEALSVLTECKAAHQRLEAAGVPDIAVLNTGSLVRVIGSTHAMTSFALLALDDNGPAELHRYAPGWQQLLAEMIPAVRQNGRGVLADGLEGWAAIAGDLAAEPAPG
ncbi:hypothetical protein [Actinoplanes sp. CA-252034]|uniref:hypothetical protein n=1 Tax=Actinoplanes sp. CA-252034 TaxID=3239906 RepID=UPI003D96590A